MNQKRIWKYEIAIKNTQHVQMPRHAEPIAVGMQRGKLCLWAIVHEPAKTVARTIHVAGTGHPCFGRDIAPFNHIGTVNDDGLIWHVFDGGEVS